MRVLTDKRTGSWLPRGRGNRRKVDWEFGISKLLIYRMGFPGGSEGKASARNAGDLGSIPGSGRSPGEGNGNPLQYSRLENPMGGGAWWATVHRVAKSQTRLSNFAFTFTFIYRIVEREMATHSGILAWRIPWAEGPGGLQSTGSQRVGHD